MKNFSCTKAQTKAMESFLNIKKVNRKKVDKIVSNILSKKF